MKKTGSKKIADRYVIALFEVASATNSLPAVGKDLLAIAEVLESNADFRAFLHNPLLTREAKGKIAETILKSLGANKITSQFVALLAAHNRLDLLPEMIELFLAKAATARGELAAELVVARAVSAAETGAIAEKLGNAYNKKINLQVREDSGLIGGSIINIASLRLDGSIAGKLERLALVLRAA